MAGLRLADPVRADAWRRAILWAGVSLAAYLFTGLVALLAVGLGEQAALPAIGIGPTAQPWVHGAAMGAEPLLWGTLMVISLPRVGRAIIGPLRPAARLTWAIVIGGLVVAAIVQLALFGWTIERFGSYRIEAIGASAVLPAALVTTSLSFLAARVARAEARTIARIVLGLSLSVSGAILLLNVPGLHDGIRPGSLVLAGTMAVATAFVICVGLVAFAAPRGRPRR